MKAEFLHRGPERNPALILFFSGWGMDGECVRDLVPPTGTDVLALYDYTEPEPLPAEVDLYRSLHLAAWSFGVRAAAEHLALFPHRLESASAFAGTLRPVDATFGIDPEIVRGTLNVWTSESARDRFARRLTGKPERMANLSRRSPESQTAELAALIERFSTAEPAGSENLFSRAFVPERDKIFPPSAQKNYWSGSQVRTETLFDAPHAFFAGAKTWKELLEND